MQRFARQVAEDGSDPTAKWGADRVKADSEDPDDEDNVPIPAAVPGPATGKTRASSIRDWSDDEDNDCEILEVYDPRPISSSYPVPSPPADPDVEVLEVEPLATGGAKGQPRKRANPATSSAGTSDTTAPAPKKARKKVIVKLPREQIGRAHV